MFLFQPFFLILCEHKILPQYLLFSVESTHYYSDKEVEDQEIAQDDEKHEEYGPVYVIVLYWLLVNTD
jgi:hypothetical protein